MWRASAGDPGCRVGQVGWLADTSEPTATKRLESRTDLQEALAWLQRTAARRWMTLVSS